MPETDVKKRKCNRLKCSSRCTRKVLKGECPSSFKILIDAFKSQTCHGIQFVLPKTNQKVA